MTTELDIRPRGFGIYTSMAIGVFVSLPLTLLISRLAGRARYEGYWQHLEERSKVGRRPILLMWAVVGAIALALGIESLPGSR
jgi:hypothetical protein